MREVAGRCLRTKPLFRDTIGWLLGVTEADRLSLRDRPPPVGHLEGNLRPFLWGRLGHSRWERNSETKKGSPGPGGERRTGSPHCAGLGITPEVSSLHSPFGS